MAYYIVHHYCKHRKETIFSEKTKGILLYFNHVFFQMTTFFKTGVYNYICICTGFEPGCAISPIPHCNWNYPLKKPPRGQFLPFKIEKKLKKKHTQRVLFQYRNCTLKQNMESIIILFYRSGKKKVFFGLVVWM